MAESGVRAIKSKNTGKDWRWGNPKSKNSGSITIVRRYQSKDIECVEARVRISNKRRQIMDELDNFCLNEKNEWVDDEDIEK